MVNWEVEYSNLPIWYQKAKFLVHKALSDCSSLKIPILLLPGFKLWSFVPTLQPQNQPIRASNLPTSTNKLQSTYGSELWVMYKAINGISFTHTWPINYMFIVGMIEILYPQTRISTQTNIISIRWVRVWMTVV